MKIKKKITENNLDDINAASDIECCIMTFKIKTDSVTDIFMLRISANFNFSVNHAFSLLHF